MAKVAVLLLTICCAPHLGESLQVDVDSDVEKGCGCLSWREAFTPKYGANCDGMGDPYLCQSFLMQLPAENFCMNYFFGNTTQWCYTPAHCKKAQKLTWAADGKESKKVAWMECGGKKHQYLQQKKMLDLSAWCRKNDLDVGVAAQFAYPTLEKEVLTGVQSYWNVPPFPNTPIIPVNETLKPKLQELVESKRSMFITSSSKRSPFAVVEGREFYWINLATPFIQLVINGKEHSMRPGEVNDVKCVAGCEKTANPWWTALNKEDPWYTALHKD